MIGLPFSPAMAVAACAGRKTQTRRLSGLEAVNAAPDKWHLDPIVCPSGARIFQRGFDTVSCKPRYHVGQRVCLLTEWATRQEWDNLKPTQLPANAEIWHAGMGERSEWTIDRLGVGRRGRFLPNHLRPLMPVFEITGVKCEWVASISDEDSLAEGVQGDECIRFHSPFVADQPTPVMCFANLWDSINGAKKGFGWQANPWVFCYEFKGISQ